MSMNEYGRLLENVNEKNLSLSEFRSHLRGKQLKLVPTFCLVGDSDGTFKVGYEASRRNREYWRNVTSDEVYAYHLAGRLVSLIDDGLVKYVPRYGWTIMGNKDAPNDSRYEANGSIQGATLDSLSSDPTVYGLSPLNEKGDNNE